MLQVSKLIPQGQGLASALLKRAATVELDWDVRQKSRFDTTDSTGRHLGVFLPRGTLVRGGDVLVAADGSLIRVLAAPQAVLKITACVDHGTPFDLIRAAGLDPVDRKGMVFNPISWKWSLSARDLSCNYVTASIKR